LGQDGERQENDRAMIHEHASQDIMDAQAPRLARLEHSNMAKRAPTRQKPGQHVIELQCRENNVQEQPLFKVIESQGTPVTSSQKPLKVSPACPQQISTGG